MAIIKCPECGHQVSEKAPSCPSCGVQIAGKITRCNECGCVYFSDQPMCPECNCPTQSQVRPAQPYRVQPPQPMQPAQQTLPQGLGSQGAQQGEQGQDQNGKEQPKKSHTALIISFLFALIVAGVAFYFYNNANSQREEDDYEYAMNSSDPLVLQQYLNQHKGENPEHCDSIQAHLLRLQQQDNDWTNACVSGTKTALQDYIENHPDSPHKAEAMNKIDSIDYFAAQKAGTAEAYKEYQNEHPDGKYIDEIADMLTQLTSTTVQPEDQALVKGIFRRFFQSINSRNEDGLLATVADTFSSLLGKMGAPKSDIVTVMNKLYRDNVANLNWHMLDDFKIDKQTGADGTPTFKVSFTAEKNVQTTDGNSTTERYRINGNVDGNGKISSFTMTKLAE